MPFVLLFFAVVFIVVAFRGTTKQFLSLLEEDFISTSGFLPWAVAVLAIGAVGYVPRVKPLSDAFLVLIIIVMLISNKGFFSDLSSQFASLGASGAGSSTTSGSTSGTGSTAATSSGGLNPTGSSLTGSATSSLNAVTTQLHSVLGGLGGVVETDSSGNPLVPLGSGESVGGLAN